MLQIRDSQAVAAAITMMSVSWIPENTTYHSSQSRHCGEGYVRLRSRCDSHLPTLMVTVLSSNRLFVISLVVSGMDHLCLEQQYSQIPWARKSFQDPLDATYVLSLCSVLLDIFHTSIIVALNQLASWDKTQTPNSYEMYCKKPDRSTAQGNAIAPFLSSFLNIWQWV